jgi:hypothetical protein
VKEIQHGEKEKDDSENDSGSSSGAPPRGFKRYGPGATPNSGATTNTAQPSAGIVFRF